jgi:PmbA protein
MIMVKFNNMNEDTKLTEFKTLITDSLKQIKKFGADSAECAILENKGFAVIVRSGETESVEYNHDKIFTITAYRGKQSGTATAKDIKPESLTLAAEKACHIAQFTEADPYTGLADKELLAFGYPELDLYHPWNISTDEAIAKAKECEAIAFAADKRIINSDGCSIKTSEIYYGYGNTNDFVGASRGTAHNIYCSLIAEQNKQMQRDHDFSVARNSNELKTIDEIAKSAAKITTDRLGAKNLTTRSSPVIFNPESARTLLKTFIRAITGKNLYRNSSFLLNHLNQQLFPSFINIDERPHLLGKIGSAAFDYDGVATNQKYFIRNGILENYVLDVYSARKLNMCSTGNSGGVHNLFINSGTLDREAMFQQMHQGLFVTELFSNGINIVTGDFSCGVFGFWIENGVISRRRNYYRWQFKRFISQLSCYR